METTGAFWIFLITYCAIQVCGQSVEMDSGGQIGYVGSKVDLRCVFLNSVPPVKISQVTWQKLVNGSKQMVAIANPSLGVSVAPPYRERVRFRNVGVRRRVPSLEDTTLTFSSLRLFDDATYICEYTTFPAGNRENTVNLTIYARPVIQVRLATPTLVARASTLKTPVATCLSANGKPAGTIKWETRVPGEATFQEVRNMDGTVTVKSDYILIPNRDMHLEPLTCIVTYIDEVYSDSVTLDVQYDPEVTVEGFDGNWYLNREGVSLTCQVDANPPVSLFQWKLMNGSIPASVEIRENILIFKDPITYKLAGTYMCDATNSIGTQSASVQVIIAEKPLPLVAPGDVMSVVGLLLAGGVTLGIAITVLVLKIKNHCTKRGREAERTTSSPSSKTPPPAKRKPAEEIQGSGQLYEELPSTGVQQYVSYRLACNNEAPSAYSPPINPPLSLLPQHPYPPSQAPGSSPLPNDSASHTSPIFRYPSLPPGVTPPPTVCPYTFPKEQYV